MRPVAYFEPFAVGSTLIDMPIFLTEDRFINVPLERTYMEAWQGVPRALARSYRSTQARHLKQFGICTACKPLVAISLLRVPTFETQPNRYSSTHRDSFHS